MKKLYKKYKQIVNYIIVGGLTTVVSLASYYICVIWFLDPMIPLQLQVANIISWVCAVAFAYITNRKFVFESENKNKVKEAVKFVTARLSTLIIDSTCMALFVSVFALNDKIAKIIVQFIVFILNYIFSKYMVFKNAKT
jgi:putative flippase GtrA